MALLRGHRQIISYAFESVYGTAVTPTKRLSRNATFDNNLDTNNYEEVPDSDGGVGVTAEIGDESYGGTLEFSPQDWEFFQYAWGTTTNTGSSPTTHTFSEANTIPSFTLEVADSATSNFVRTYEGCKVKKLRFEWAPATGGGNAGLVKVRADIVAEDMNLGTSITSLSTGTSQAFKYRMGVLTLNGVTKTLNTRGFIEINNNLDDGRYTNNTTLISEPEIQKRNYTAEFSMAISGATDATIDWDLFKDRASFNGTLVFTRGANDDMTFTFTNINPDRPAYPTVLGDKQIITLAGSVDSITGSARDSLTYDIT